jgi:hypothetical protein
MPFQLLLKPQHLSLHGQVTSRRMEDRNTLTKTQAKLNITMDGKTRTTHMTAWLSITNQVLIHIPKV